MDSDTMEIKYRTTFPEKEEFVTDPVIYNFEKIKILATRALHLKVGGKPAVYTRDMKGFDCIAIAEREFQQRVIPILLIRKIPTTTEKSGFKEEIWNPNDMSRS